MYKAMNYWIFGGFDGQKTPCEFIDWAKSQKLDGVELTVGDAVKADISEAECKKISDYAKQKKIGLRTIATGFYWGNSLGSEDEEERDRAVAFTRQYLRIASWLGVETVLVVPGSSRVPWDPSRPVVSYKTVWVKSLKSLRELAKLAEELKVNIGLENVWGRFLFSPIEWEKYLDEIKSDRIGMYLDVANCCPYVRPQDYVEVLGKKIMAVHMKNWSSDNLAGGNLLGFGEDITVGDVDFPAVLAALDKIGYKGTFTAEMIPFCRLPDLRIPDMDLAAATAARLISLCHKS